MKRVGTYLVGLSLAWPMFSATELELEQLLGVTVSEGGISFQVASQGCTTRDDFTFQVAVELEPLSPMLPALEPHHYITLSRKNPDMCEGFVPYGTVIFMSFDELRIHVGKFHVQNPIGGDKVQLVP